MRFSALFFPALLLSIPAHASLTCTVADSYRGNPISSRSFRLEESQRAPALRMDHRAYHHPFDILEIQSGAGQNGSALPPLSLWLGNGTARDFFGKIQNGRATVYPLLHWDFGGTEPDPADFFYRIDLVCVAAS